MSNTHTARSVPGEIMAGASQRSHGYTGSRDHSDVIEADFEVIATDRILPPERPAAAKAETGNPVAGLTFLAKQAPSPTGWFGRPGGAAFLTLGIGLAAIAFWMLGGHTLVTSATRPQALHAALTLMGVTSRVDSTGNNPILLIDGEAGNDGGTFATVPPIEIRVASLDGSVTRYKLGTSSPVIGPGERFAFSSRLEVPKNGVKSVSVTFAE
jgi:hypothetical protein